MYQPLSYEIRETTLCFAGKNSPRQKPMRAKFHPQVLLVLRLLPGYSKNPCLANGGACKGDMFHLPKLLQLLAFWVAAATSGLALGPLVSGFSVPPEIWRCSLWGSFGDRAQYSCFFSRTYRTGRHQVSYCVGSEGIENSAGCPHLMGQSAIVQSAVTIVE